ncbi:MAG TPA: ATP-binding protein, partial [Allosphingosinicella sp.]
MTDMNNLHSIPLPASEGEGSPVTPAFTPQADSGQQWIGRVLAISGSSATIEFDSAKLYALANDPDPSVAMSGQVGSQVRLQAQRHWLLANVRSLSISADGNAIQADVDFLGEGDEDPHSGQFTNFKRGVTTYPLPGSRAFPVTRNDLKQIYAADERAHVEIGTVYPTRDVRASLLVDSFLGKHFALLGSTGTGKSTSAALIMHKICDMSPEGHIVMIDPHGEYSAAFKGDGELFNVDNLAMPYWLMNFEEHCEVFITTQGADRQQDMDILAKCLLQARSKNRTAEGLNKLTVDSPIPYTLSDLTNAISNEMGLLNKATDTAPYMRLKSKIDELKSDPRYQFMFSGMLIADTMSGFLSKVFRLP